jgi:hypothetical protein
MVIDIKLHVFVLIAHLLISRMLSSAGSNNTYNEFIIRQLQEAQS